MDTPLAALDPASPSGPVVDLPPAWHEVLEDGTVRTATRTFRHAALGARVEVTDMPREDGPPYHRLVSLYPAAAREPDEALAREVARLFHTTRYAWTVPGADGARHAYLFAAVTARDAFGAASGAFPLDAQRGVAFAQMACDLATGRTTPAEAFGPIAMMCGSPDEMERVRRALLGFGDAFWAFMRDVVAPHPTTPALLRERARAWLAATGGPTVAS